MAPSPTVVLVPGGFLGPWIWQDVEARLREAGLDTVAIELASVPMDDETPAGDLHDDAAAVRDVLDHLDAPALLCGHSYGGAVITQAATAPHPAVQRLVYLAAAVPDEGESLADLAPPQEPAEHDGGDAGEAEQVEFRPDGTIRLLPESAAAALFNDCDSHATSRAVAQLRPMNPAVNSQPVTAPAWRHLPVTYVRCTHDQMPELVTAGFLDNVEDPVELPTGHCPQWSRPDLVADLLVQRAR